MIKNLTICFLVSAFTLGCASSGNASLKNLDSEKANSQIKKGFTTKSEIRAMYGDPLTTTFTTEGLLIWTYQLNDVSHLTLENVASGLITLGLAGSKSRGTKNEVVILFDENDKVKSFNASTSKVEQGSGLFK
jgi:hypothetical protein